MDTKRLTVRQNLTREQLERTRKLMDTSARDCLVTGYEFLIPTLRSCLETLNASHGIRGRARGRDTNPNFSRQVTLLKASRRRFQTASY